MKYWVIFAIFLPVICFGQTPHFEVQSIGLNAGESGMVEVSLVNNSSDLYGLSAVVRYDANVVHIDSVSVEGSIIHPYEEWSIVNNQSGIISFYILEIESLTPEIYMDNLNGLVGRIYFTIDEHAFGGDYYFLPDYSDPTNEAIAISPRSATSVQFVQLTTSVLSVHTCCEGVTGNLNGDNVLDISDLLYLVDFVFAEPKGPAPVCWQEADANGSGQVDITDLLYLVDYMFLENGTTLPGCQ